MRIHNGLVFVIVATVAVAAGGELRGQKPSDSVASLPRAQNSTFKEKYQSDLRNFPENATAYGDYRYNDMLEDYSLAAIAERHKTDEAFLARLAAVSTAGFPDQDQLSHDVMVR